MGANRWLPKGKGPSWTSRLRPSVAMLRALTALGWFVLAAVVAYKVLDVALPVLPALLSHISSLSVGGETAKVTLTFDALAEPSGGRDEPGPLSLAELRPLRTRALQLAPKLSGRRFLWVDSRYPQKEAAALVQLGVTVDYVNSTGDALARLEQRGYDLLVTNMKRNNQYFEGVSLLNQMCQQRFSVPAVIYSWGFDPTTGVPINATAASDRASLFQIIFDAAELGFPRARCQPNFCPSNDIACLPERFETTPAQPAACALIDDQRPASEPCALSAPPGSKKPKVATQPSAAASASTAASSPRSTSSQ